MFLKFAYRPVSNVALLNRNALETIDNDVFQLIIYCFYCVRHMRSSTFETGLIYRAGKAGLEIVGRKIMKFLHEMIPIFCTFFTRRASISAIFNWLQKHSRSYRSSFYRVHWDNLVPKTHSPVFLNRVGEPWERVWTWQRGCWPTTNKNKLWMYIS